MNCTYSYSRNCKGFILYFTDLRDATYLEKHYEEIFGDRKKHWLEVSKDVYTCQLFMTDKSSETYKQLSDFLPVKLTATKKSPTKKKTLKAYLEQYTPVNDSERELLKEFLDRI